MLKYHEHTIHEYNTILKFCHNRSRSVTEIYKLLGKSDAATYQFCEKLVRDGFMVKEAVVAKGKKFTFRATVSELPIERKLIKPVGVGKFEFENGLKWVGNPFRQTI